MGVIISFVQVTAHLRAERFNRIDDMNEKDRMMEEQKQRRIDETTDDHHEWHAIYDQEYVRILDTRAMVLQRQYWSNSIASKYLCQYSSCHRNVFAVMTLNDRISILYPNKNYDTISREYALQLVPNDQRRQLILQKSVVTFSHCGEMAC